MDAFCEVVDTFALKDMGFRGSSFNWKCGNSPNTLVREYIEKFLVDNEWCNLFLCVNIRHFPILI